MSPAPSRRRPRRILLATVLVWTVVSCGRTTPTNDERVVVVTAPSLAPRVPVVELLPTPPPTPSPTPRPPTPEPTPRATRTPMGRPGPVTMTARSGGQQGAANASCWSETDGRRVCAEPEQPPVAVLAVSAGEEVVVRIGADRAPSSQWLVVFQAGTEPSGQQPLEPALHTTLRIDLEPGEWMLDLCASWSGYGSGLCWGFRLSVAA